MSLKIITGANDSYILTLLDFINAFIKLGISSDTLIVYDLGLNQINKQTLTTIHTKYNFILKTLDYSLYPEHVDLNKYYGLYCSYAFKPIIIYNEATRVDNKDTILIWMDAANRFTINTLNQIYTIVKTNGLYSPISNGAGTIESVELNHHSVTIQLLGLSEHEHKHLLSSVSGNLIGLNYGNPTAKTIINEWYDKSLKREFIMPEGSSRNNHRQDQTLLSALIFLYEKTNNIVFDKHLVNDIHFWNKKDNSTVQDGYFPFKLINKKTNNQLAIIYCKNKLEAIETYTNRKLLTLESFTEQFTITN